MMKLVIGLGNPGSKYACTRHNIGFLALDFLREKYDGTPWNGNKKFFANISWVTIEGEKVLLIKPETFMNLSGKSLRAVFDFFKIENADVCILSDDVALDFGVVRFREKGSHGGHNGLRDIFAKFSSSNFSRIKMGIKNETLTQIPMDKFVLQKFSEQEKNGLSSIFSKMETVFLQWVV